MSNFLDKLNLRPQERRLVVVVAVVVFIVLNVWMVFPKFGDLGRVQQRIRDAGATLEKYQQEVDRQGEYEKELAKLQAMGYFIPSEERALQLQRDVTAQAGMSQVSLNSVNPVNRASYRTNAFFEEQSLILSVGTTLEKDLVDFLYNLGKRDSLTRVKNMDLRPDPTRIYLSGSITVVRSFQRKASTRATAAPRTSAPAPAGATSDAVQPPADKAAGSGAAPTPVPARAAPTTAPNPNPSRELPKRAAPQPIK